MRKECILRMTLLFFLSLLLSVSIDAKEMNDTFVKQRVEATETGITLTWGSVKGAQGYEIFGSEWNDSTAAKLTTRKASKKRTFSVDIEHAGIYKFFIKAYKIEKGKKVYIKQFPNLYVATTNTSLTFAKKLKSSFQNLELKKGETKQLKITTIQEHEFKQLVEIENKHRYFSSDTTIATVDTRGVVKGIKKGKCSIYVYANNGVTTKVDINIK